MPEDWGNRDEAVYGGQRDAEQDQACSRTENSEQHRGDILEDGTQQARTPEGRSSTTGVGPTERLNSEFLVLLQAN